MNRFISLKKIDKEEYGGVLCYPKRSPEELAKRLMEMAQLGVKAVSFQGEKKVNGVPILGKGCVGIVLLAQTDKRKVAVKIRRTDADRAEMRREAEMLETANSVSVGPKLLRFSENLLMMEFVDGILLPEWVETIGDTNATLRLRRVLRDILEQCWRLDGKGLDHGELSQASKHIMIYREDKACLLDFETASLARRVANVTSACHYLFMGGETARTIGKKIGETSKDHLLAALRAYKRKCTREGFEAILKACVL